MIVSINCKEGILTKKFLGKNTLAFCGIFCTQKFSEPKRQCKEKSFAPFRTRDVVVQVFSGESQIKKTTLMLVFFASQIK